MNKWTQWYDSLPEHTKESLKNQPLWHDSDLFKAAIFGAVIGFTLGAIL
jgi:hypothetical protein